MDPKILQARISERENNGNLRKLWDLSAKVDFTSNDYLGFAKDLEIWEEANNLLKVNTVNVNGSTGSRLLSGHHKLLLSIEDQIAKFHNAEAGILFNSGFDANTGLLGSVIQKDDYVICDSLLHASLIDGVRLSKAKRLLFEHNDPLSLEAQLIKAQGFTIYIVIESVYSMEGDLCKLLEICLLAKKYSAHIIIDEAHATGIIGEKGEGLVSFLGLEKEIFARIHTFGKALGSHGAIVLGSKKLKEYLINFARPLIFSTMIPLHGIIASKLAYDNLTKNNDKLLLIRQKIKLFKELLKGYSPLLESTTPIQGILISGNNACKLAAKNLQEKGFDVRPILSPTVAKGKERIRICLHTFNTDEEIEFLTQSIKHLQL